MIKAELEFEFDNSDTVKELEELKKELESTKKKYLIDMQEKLAA